MATIEITRLPGLIRRIEANISEAGEAPSFDDWAGWKAHQRKFGAIIDDLVREESASYRAGVSDAYRLKIAGLSTSATGGDHAVLCNWINAAKRKLQVPA